MCPAEAGIQAWFDRGFIVKEALFTGYVRFCEYGNI
jgi:hypothetical protein